MQSMTYFDVARRSISRMVRNGLVEGRSCDPSRSKSEARRIGGAPTPGASPRVPADFNPSGRAKVATAGESYFERRDATLPRLVAVVAIEQVQTRAPPCFARSA